MDETKALGRKSKGTPPQSVKVNPHNASSYTKEHIIQKYVDSLLWYWEYGLKLVKTIWKGTHYSD